MCTNAQHAKIRKPGLLSAFFMLFILNIPLFCFGQRGNQIPPNKTGSPYFIIKGGTENHVVLPLKSTEAEVNIAGVIADVKVRQTYINTGDQPIEAEYVFPGSTKSAVYGMQMVIGKRVIKAKIKEKQEAQQQYDQAKADGKKASLLQQHRPNVFQMNVANILPGDTIEVELNYTEMLVPEEGQYEFVYPTVVGPRYADEQGVIKDPWVMNPHTNPQAYNATFSKPTFDITTSLVTGIPIKQALTPSHETIINYDGANQARINLKTQNGYEGDRDFVMRYQLSGEQVESGLSLFEGKDEKFFLMMLEPPARVEPSQIPPREYVFIVDVSGSMNGYPIAISKTLMANLFKQLRPVDKFNVLLFAAGSAVFAERSVTANKSNLEAAYRFIDKEKGSGGTQLLNALQRALALPGSPGYSKTVVIATDGYVTVEKESFDLIRNNLGKANFFPFGIGSSVNRFIIEGMAHAGRGEPLIVLGQTEAYERAEQFRKYIQNPVLTDIKLHFNDFEAYDVEPLNVPDVFSERPIVVFGKYKGKPGGSIKVTGVTGAGKFESEMKIAEAQQSDKNAALRYLWARNRIKTLSDYNKVSRNSALKEQITQLGLNYNLLTDYTSFLAIDNSKTDKKQTATKSGSIPEPHEWTLIFMVTGVLIFLVFQRYRA